MSPGRVWNGARTNITSSFRRKFPANSKEIAIARSYGDLRENHEYKAAKEMHKLLMRRKGELEDQLVRARGTDFSTVKTDQVGLGTVVGLTDLQTQHTETYTILGAWDFDADKHIISYLSPMAQALLGHKPGEEVRYETEGAAKHYRIDSIQAYKAPAPDRSSGRTRACAERSALGQRYIESLEISQDHGLEVIPPQFRGLGF